MSKLFIKLIFILLFSNYLFAQEYKWRTLPNSPVANTRFNDCSFINANTGWVCNTGNNIYKTTNGGVSWFIVGSTISGNRCIAFFDSLRGWVGAYSSGNTFSKTTDGGVTWHPIAIPPPAGTGLCGFSIVNDSVLYGCGRYWGSGC